MTQDSNVRTAVSTGTLFVSLPDQFGGAAPESLRHFVKVGFESVLHKDGRVGTAFSPQWLLLDLAMIPTGKLDLAKVTKDCDLVKEIVSKHPEHLQSLLVAVHRAMNDSENRFGEVDRITKEIGLREDAFVSKGGGLIWLIALAVLGAAGCFAHTGLPPTKTAVDVKKGEK